MTSEANNLRKAAIVVDSLDRDAADALLDQMDASQAARVRQAVMELPDVPGDERERVIAEFLGRPPSASASASAKEDSTLPNDDGIELEPSLADRLARDDEPPDRQRAAPDSPGTPFRFLQDADGKLIAEFLREENPQTIAVVLAHLPPPRAADALARLTSDLRTDVIRRIAVLDDTPPDVLRDVEVELGSRLSEQLQMRRRRKLGLTAIRQILDAAAISDRDDMLAHLVAADAALADELAAAPTSRHSAFSAPRAAKTARSTVPKLFAHGNRPPDWLESPAPSPLRSAGAARDDTVPHVGGVAGYLASIVAAEGAAEPPVVAETPSNGQPPLAQATGTGTANMPAKFAFDELAQVSDSALANVFAQVDIDVALLALTAADRQLVQRLTKQLSPRQARQIRKRLARPGQLRLSDIERAQAEVARAAELLIENHEMPRPVPRERLTAAT